MMIESDILVVHIKSEDRLKAVADTILLRIARGELKVIASREVLHELYYVLKNMNLYMPKSRMHGIRLNKRRKGRLML
ncbi:hypothetical protein J5U22_02268 [Saccharolobus shibatae]|uniref:Uncharacterized protein n=1 Tax=Saccharolobus shibatae TaxID=2286 RepID=A0A8F5C2D4_9CREN|nr:hypothetical protein J5U21_02207 [Saccharolobus shibatae]QXJ35721.1 hypothetical protein J5U22_02268 [Saccharolobus shibatae]